MLTRLDYCFEHQQGLWLNLSPADKSKFQGEMRHTTSIFQMQKTDVESKTIQQLHRLSHISYKNQTRFMVEFQNTSQMGQNTKQYSTTNLNVIIDIFYFHI